MNADAQSNVITSMEFLINHMLRTESIKEINAVAIADKGIKWS